jgi:predicted regulator of amino acid metabolism with ACT domain
MSEAVDTTIADIREPSPSDKLHPHENEPGSNKSLEKLRSESQYGHKFELSDWEEFRLSVGTEPIIPPIVQEADDDVSESYELVDGDRRLRAVKANYGDVAEDEMDITVIVMDDTDNWRDVHLTRITANEHNKASDKIQRARYLSRLYRPALLPPGERIQGGESEEEIIENTQTQTEIAEKIGTNQGTVSKWISPIRTEHKLRGVLVSIGTAGNGKGWHGDAYEETKRVDRIVSLLLQGNDPDGEIETPSRVVATGNEGSVAEEMQEVDEEGLGLTLVEVEEAAEKAADEGLDNTDIVEYVEDNCSQTEGNEKDAFDDDDVESGLIGAEDESENPLEANDGSSFEDTENSTDGSSDDSVEEPDTDENGESEYDSRYREAVAEAVRAEEDFEEDEIDWEELINEDELSGETSMEELIECRKLSEFIQDDASIGIHTLAEITGIDRRKIVQEFVEPIICRRISQLLEAAKAEAETGTDSDAKAAEA